MYNKYGSKSMQVKYLEEGEPPPKKIITEGNILIKNLTEKQRRTKTTLSEYINQQQKFTRSVQLVDMTGQVCGKSTLKDFQTIVCNVDELNKLKSKGLDDRDVEIYKDYLNLDSNFWDKYKHLNEDVLKQRLQEIIQIVDHLPSTTKFVDTGKPNALDELAHLEKDFTGTNYSKCDIKKIRKKARSLGNKIKDLNETTTLVNNPKDFNVYKVNRATLWDVKEKPVQKECVNMINKNKKYTCDPQTSYTIRNGQIIKLNQPEKIIKLTTAEIKKIPKFAMYEAGNPSKILFLKNLGKKVNEKSLETFLGNFEVDSYTIRIMKGKMKGQAFITFRDQVQATQGLQVLNGVFIDGRPITAQFGKELKC